MHINVVSFRTRGNQIELECATVSITVSVSLDSDNNSDCFYSMWITLSWSMVGRIWWGWGVETANTVHKGQQQVQAIAGDLWTGEEEWVSECGSECEMCGSRGAIIIIITIYIQFDHVLLWHCIDDDDPSGRGGGGFFFSFWPPDNVSLNVHSAQ